MARAGGFPDMGRLGTTDGKPLSAERKNGLALDALSDHLDQFREVPTERFQADVERLLGLEFALGYSNEELEGKIKELEGIIKDKKYNPRMLVVLGGQVEKLKASLRDRPKAANDDEV